MFIGSRDGERDESDGDETTVDFFAGSGGLLVATAASGASQGVPDEGWAMAINVAEYLKANGPDKAFAAFSVKDGPWHDDVTAFAHAGGKSIRGIVVAVKVAGWMEFNRRNQTMKRTEPETECIVGLGEYLVGSDAYRN